MLPLLIKDGLLVPCLATTVLFSVLYCHFYPSGTDRQLERPIPRSQPNWPDILLKLAFCISMVGMVVLTMATVIIPPPVDLPFLFPLIVSVYSCGHFLMFLVYFHYAQFTTARRVTPASSAIEKSEKVAVNDAYKTSKVKPWKSEKAKRKKRQ